MGREWRGENLQRTYIEYAILNTDNKLVARREINYTPEDRNIPPRDRRLDSINVSYETDSLGALYWLSQLDPSAGQLLGDFGLTVYHKDPKPFQGPYYGPVNKLGNGIYGRDGKLFGVEFSLNDLKSVVAPQPNPFSQGLYLHFSKDRVEMTYSARDEMKSQEVRFNKPVSLKDWPYKLTIDHQGNDIRVTRVHTRDRSSWIFTLPDGISFQDWEERMKGDLSTWTGMYKAYTPNFVMLDSEEVSKTSFLSLPPGNRSLPSGNR